MERTSPEDILVAVRDALWYDRLCDHYDYHEACDLFELLLLVRNQVEGRNE